MKVSDLLGAGKGIDKLIDVIQKGLGRAFKANFERKDIETRALEIEKLAEAQAKALGIMATAVRQNTLGTGSIKYSNNGIEITSNKENNGLENYVLQEAVIADRIKLKESYQGIIKQLNIENVTAIAAEELKNENEISDEPVNQDWANRFFNIVGDVSDEEMQTLWGRILAGEVKQPNSYSLRTLELLRNLSKTEAETFINISKLAIGHNTFKVIFKGDDEVYKDYGLYYLDFAAMVEIGILQPSDFTTLSIGPKNEEVKQAFTFGNHAVLISIPPMAKTIPIPVFLYTTTGIELLKLIDVEPPLEYHQKFVEYLKGKERLIKAQYGKVNNIIGSRYEFENLVDI